MTVTDNNIFYKKESLSAVTEFLLHAIQGGPKNWHHFYVRLNFTEY